jgi:hypothetical protein
VSSEPTTPNPIIYEDKLNLVNSGKPAKLPSNSINHVSNGFDQYDDYAYATGLPNMLKTNIENEKQNMYDINFDAFPKTDHTEYNSNMYKIN